MAAYECYTETRNKACVAKIPNLVIRQSIMVLENCLLHVNVLIRNVIAHSPVVKFSALTDRLRP